MRAVTFADPDTILYLRKEYVLLWHNQSPGLFGEGQPELPTPEQMQNYPDGAGGGNVQTFFCTPDGRPVVHLQGLWRPQRFLAEAKFAAELAKTAAKLSDEQRATLIENALADRRNSIRRHSEALSAKHPAEMQKKVYESEVRKQIAALGLLEETLKPKPEIAKPLAAALQEIVVRNARTRPFV